jgi:hypothetical protein
MKKNIAIIFVFTSLVILSFLLFFKKDYFSNFFINKKTNSFAPPLLNKIAVNWLTYENKTYSFAFSYPNKSLNSSYWASQSDNLNNLASNIVLEGDNVFYIRPEGQNFKQVDNIYNKIQQDSNGMDRYGVTWRIVVNDINQEQDLDSFIKKQYGNGCSYDKKYATDYPNTFDVIIKGDGKPLDVTDCPVNYDYHIKYSPDKKKVAFWHTGQECQIGLNFSTCFDSNIVKSFRFLNN